MASLLFTSFPVAHHCRFDSQPFRLLLLGRFWLPLRSIAQLPVWLAIRQRVPGSGFWDAVQHGFAVRVSVNVRVQDMDLARPDAFDNRRLEIVRGSPFFREHSWLWTPWVVSVFRRDCVLCQQFLNQLAKAKARPAHMGISLGLQRGESFCPFLVGAKVWGLKHLPFPG